MFAVILRIAAGLAIGGAAAVWLTRRQRSPDRQKRLATSRDEAPVDETALDEAVEDTFPASDPPAFTQSLIARPPPRDQPAEEDAAEAHPS